MTCKIKACGRPTFARGYCSLHYSRWRHKQPMHGPRYPSRLSERQIAALKACPAAELASLAKQMKISRKYAYAIRAGVRNPIGRDSNGIPK